MEGAETQSLTRVTASEDLPRPPGGGGSGAVIYDNDKARRRAGDAGGFFRCCCISFLVIIVLAITINTIVVVAALKTAEMPRFHVQRVQVSKFDVQDSSMGDQVVLSTNMDFYLEANNKNSLTGVDFGSMVMDATWDEAGAHLGEAYIANFKQKSQNVTVLKISTHGQTDVSKKAIKREDMKMSLGLSGNIKFNSAFFSSKSYPFLVTCDNLSIISTNFACNSKLYGTRKTQSPAKATPPEVQPRSQPDSLAPELAQPADSPDSVEPTKQDSKSPTPTQPHSRAPAPARRDSRATAPAPVDEAPVTNISSFPPVKLIVQDKYVILDNGLLAVTIAKPGGYVTGMNYNGMDNILLVDNPEEDRGYWDVVWAPPHTRGTKGKFERIIGSVFRVIVEKEEQIELSFKMPYDISKKNTVPLEIDQRYILMRGESGIYAYGIFERAAWPGFGMPNARLAFKLHQHKFKYIVVADNRQRDMPLPDDRLKPRGEELAYPEAVLLNDPIEPQFKGEVDDKYQYSSESQDIRVHGWICKDPPTGFWQITPSFEFRSGGANKQFLTSHVGPSTLAMFLSAHYSGEELVPRFEEGEPWKHVYGPIFMYVNQLPMGQDFHLLWEDAKKKMLAEAAAWPYSFAASEDFPKANERGSASGRLFVHDRYLSKEEVPAKGAFVGLGPPGEAGSWQRDCKNYQFWTKTDEEGRFTIKNVHAGGYNLFGWVGGYLGDYKHTAPVNITVGHNVELGDLVYEPPRDGPTLWEIGIPDRVAKEFHIPDPNPKYVNRLYVNHTDRWRQYGLWERYAELYPRDDLVYTINVSDYKKDWFFAQVTRQIGNRYNGTTWQVKFKLEQVVPNGVYKLRLAIASATNSELEVRFNAPKPSPPIFTTGRIGNDNSIARHGIHGLYWLYNIDVQGSLLKQGENTLFLTQTKGSSPFQGIMYDYIRLEGPPASPK